MTKGCLVVIAGFFGLYVSLPAQQIPNGGTLNSLMGPSGNLPLLTLSDARFPFSTSGAWIGASANDFLPDWRPAGWENNANLSFATTEYSHRQTATTGSTLGFSKNSPKEVSNLRQSSPFDYVHGEVGFLYGRSSGGRNSLETESGYIWGVTGNDKFQISAGAFYENSNFDFSRRRR
jgi:hypothetical protein